MSRIKIAGKVSTISEIQMIPFLGQKEQRGTKEPLDEGERGE